MGPPQWMQSIRFRLTVIYSVALFVIGALVLGGIYAGLSQALDDEPISARLIEQSLVQLESGELVVVSQQIEGQLVDLETLTNERALDQLRTYSFGALALLFILSLGVGWVVAGRALRPIERITAVARDIQATDLSRRIDLAGPDDELRRLAGTFDAMLVRLDRAFEGQRRFIHDASHELRNPLATIRTNLEVALADPHASPEDLRQTAEVVDRTADRMRRVVDDLLAYARSEMPDVEHTLIDLGHLADEVIEEFDGVAEAAAVELVSHTSGDPMVRGDADALRRVLANLLTNALEHAPSGTAVVVQVAGNEDSVALSVADRGPGVPVEDRNQVFLRSWRGAGSSGRRPGGSGLGLTIVRQVVESHGGTVTVADNDGDGGACFLVSLDRAEVRPAVPESDGPFVIG